MWYRQFSHTFPLYLCIPIYIYFRARLTDAEIDNITEKAMVSLPGIGERMLMGHFKSLGHRAQRQRLRESIKRVDPIGLEHRRQMIQRRITRRVYNIPHPHYIWHIDGNHKMNRWRLYVHGAIDGYSRCCLYLECHSNNLADTVYQLFAEAIERYNIIPTRVRSDYGTENVRVWDFMQEISDLTRSPGIFLGSSVHNQRIERFNREINKNIKDKFGPLFTMLETRGILNVEDSLDIFALHYVFLPRINESLRILMNSHNNHAVSSEGNKTPYQMLATEGFDVPLNKESMDMTPIFRNENEREQLIHPEYFDHMVNRVPSLTADNDHGCTVYEAIREFLRAYCYDE